jgi:large subunit ribosomal protein L30
MAGTIKIKLVRSPICTPEKHKVIVRALGLKKINQVVERPDTPGFRGMVKKVPHLLELAADEARPKGTPRGAAK